MRKTKILKNLTIENAAAEGKCLSRVDNQVVFVERVAPGDVVDVKIRKKKKNFLEGVPILFHKLSSDRVEPFCAHQNLCGGCKWQHLSYEKQLQLKQQQVIDNLQRIGKVDASQIRTILAASENTFYRNKLEFTFSSKRWLTSEEINNSAELNRNGLGFHMPGHYDKIIDIHKCWLQTEPSNEIRNAFRNYAIEHNLDFYDVNTHKGFLRNLIIRNNKKGELMVILQVAQNNAEAIKGCIEFLGSQFPQIKSLHYIVNSKKNETFLDQEVVLAKGEEYILEDLDGMLFKIGPKSFFQTNTQQAEVLYRKAIELAKINSDHVVYDLYTGTGTIANFVAKSAKKVIGIEQVEEAIEDAKFNSRLNNIENTAFLAGDAKELFTEELFAKEGHPDVVITDPPRAGMHADVLEIIRKAQPKKVVYVSCNPATQARDLAILKEDFKIKEIQPVDMFPHTHHVENVVLLELR